MDFVRNEYGRSSEGAANANLITHALRLDVDRRFAATHDLWPTGDDRVVFFKITSHEEKIEFPQYFCRAYGQDFRDKLHLIDIKDNCLAVSICKKGSLMWLPRESLTLIRKFYNHGYMVNLAIKYVEEGIFFAMARDYDKMQLGIMYQNKYVGDVLIGSKLKWIKDVFQLDYFKVSLPDYINRDDKLGCAPKSTW
ncbi:hypothetical protein PIB30_026126 [Stylosanthes scabra]|uniref:Uncharacterized protein n=1 Tax=Stylosanthes scabra TaxID=79078 RepID=A0ABU6UBA0_9FABA|nr:hypothetical protein [Stylosanthes scabra]